MEDDFSLCSNFKNKYETIKDSFKKEDVVFLGYNMNSIDREKEEIKQIYDNTITDITIAPLNNTLYIGATFMYSINKTGAAKLLKYIEQYGIKHGIDYVMKICTQLNNMESQPQLAFSEWFETTDNLVDTDIQRDHIGLDFSKVINIMGNYTFIPNVDHIGDDLCYGKLSINDSILFANSNINCAGFNTLGFFKNKIDINNLKSSQYFGPNDGIYIKKMSNTEALYNFTNTWFYYSNLKK